MGERRPWARWLALVLCVAVVAHPSSVRADMWHYVGEWVDLRWNVSAEEAYEDNVFNATDNREDDFVTTLILDSRLTLRHPLGSFTLFYRFNQQLYLDHTELNDVGQFAGLGQNQSISFGDSIHLSPRDTLSYSNAFIRSPDSLYATGEQRAQQQPPVDLEGVVVGRQGVIRNSTQLGYRHDFRAPVTFTLNGSYAILEYDDPIQVDSRNGSAGGGLSWRLSNLRLVGLSYRHSLTRYDSLSGTDSEVVSLTYEDEPLPMWKVSARVGASFNSTADNSVNKVTPDVDVSLKKVLRRGGLSASYLRSISTSRGFGGAAELQAVNLSGSYKHTPVWTSRLSAIYSSRRSKSESTLDIDRFTLRYRTSYPISRFLRVTAGYLYSNQRQGSVAGGERIINNRLFIGLRYGASLL